MEVKQKYVIPSKKNVLQRQCELLPSLGVHRMSSIDFSHFNLLEQSLQWTFHRCFLSSFVSFGQGVSEEKI
jgi:hypothetical protein